MEIKLDWFITKRYNRKYTTIEEILDIVKLSEHHPAMAKQKLMEQIDITLDNRNEQEFYHLTNIMLAIK